VNKSAMKQPIEMRFFASDTAYFNLDFPFLTLLNRNC
jgi:hypothetical protein